MQLAAVVLLLASLLASNCDVAKTIRADLANALQAARLIRHMMAVSSSDL